MSTHYVTSAVSPGAAELPKDRDLVYRIGCSGSPRIARYQKRARHYLAMLMLASGSAARSSVTRG